MTSNDPQTRIHGRPRIIEAVRAMNQTRTTGVTKSGRHIDKNRSNDWRGYKSHLTERQRVLMRWAIRQSERGVAHQTIVEWLYEKYGWEPVDMQYPLTICTIGMWRALRVREAQKGREWP